MVYACDTCHFLFERVEKPDRCPDCGKQNIRPASPDEQREYLERTTEK